MTRYKIKLDNLNVSKTDFYEKEREQRSRGDNSESVGSLKDGRHHIFLEVKDDYNRNKGYILFDERQNEYEIEIDGCGNFRCIGGIKKKCCTEPKSNPWFNSYRLNQLHNKVDELQNEINCLKRGD